jgi:hypothetical protein
MLLRGQTIEMGPPVEDNAVVLAENVGTGGLPIIPARRPTKVGETVMGSLTFENSSDHSLTIETVSLTNQASGYSLALPSGCDGVVLLPGRSNRCTVLYTFRVSEPGLFKTELLLHMPAGNTIKTVLLAIMASSEPVNVPPVTRPPGQITPPTLIAPRDPSPKPSASSSR